MPHHVTLGFKTTDLMSLPLDLTGNADLSVFRNFKETRQS
jgi:hypothetical protein